MINSEILKILKEGKNLLAFSAGVDSSALFFLLMENSVKFDIAIVNYNLREEAKDEIAYAKELANRYKKDIFIANAPRFSNNFEASAREFRYNFFEKIVKEKQYDNLLTAHQLNDKIEWFLMRFSKGGGVSSLAGMDYIIYKDGYKIIRPLLDATKNELLQFLKNRGYRYFLDSSNYNLKYERNRFRAIADKLLELNPKNGYIRSFKILNREAELIKSRCKTVMKTKKLIIIKADLEFIGECAANALKKIGYIISFSERESFINKKRIVAGRKWVLEFSGGYLYIAPYLRDIMPKKFKEECRKLKIPPKIRPYIYVNNLLSDIKKNLNY